MALKQKEKEQEKLCLQYITFKLNNEIYAIDAMNVQEIVELGGITRIPHLPVFMKGVINLRGSIIPVVDLKTKFSMESGEYKKHTCVIVTEFSGGAMGLIVDSVMDVIFLNEDDIKSPPSFGIKVQTDFIKGISRIDAGLVIILDIEKVLSSEEMLSLQEARRSFEMDMNQSDS